MAGNSFQVTARFVADISSYVRGQAEMARANQATARSIASMQNAVDQVSRAAEEFSGSLQKVAKSSKEAAGHSEKLNDQLQKQRVVSKEAATSNEQLASSTRRVSDAMVGMSKAVLDVQVKLARRVGKGFADQFGDDIKKATSAVGRFTANVALGGAAYLALSQKARQNAFAAMTSGAARARKELQDIPGLISKIGKAYDETKSKGATFLTNKKLSPTDLKSYYETVSRSVLQLSKTIGSSVAPVVKQKGAFGALTAAVAGSFGIFKMATTNYAKFGGAINVATGGIADATLKVASGSASLRDYLELIEKAQNQEQRFKVARKIEQRRDGNAGTGEIVGRAARDVAAANLIGAGVGKVVKGITNIGRANNELGQSVGVLDRARGAYARLFDVTGGIILAQTLNRVTRSTMTFAQSTVMAGARSKELDVVLNQLGRTAGYSTANMQKQVDGLKAAGIESKAAKQALADFIKVGIPVDQAEKLAQVARDFAVLSGSDTSQAFTHIVYGLASRQTEVLRTAGVQMTFEQAFATYAKQLGKSVSDLTEMEKTQAGVNEVLKTGVKVAGAYEMAMTTAGKQLRSVKRYMNEIRTALGTELEPAFASAVRIIADFTKPGSKLAEMAKSTGLLGRAFGEVGKRAKEVFDGLYERIDKAISGFKPERVQAFVKNLIGNSKDMLGALLPAGVAGIGVVLAKNTPILGQFIRNVGAWQAALAGLVLSNRDLRGALVELVKKLLEAALVLSASVAPAFEVVADFLESNSGSLKALAAQIGDTAVSIARLGAVVITAALPAFKALLDAVGGLLKMFNAMGGTSALVAVIVGFKAFDKFSSYTRLIMGFTGALKQAGGAMAAFNKAKTRWLGAGAEIAAEAAAATTTINVNGRDREFVQRESGLLTPRTSTTSSKSPSISPSKPTGSGAGAATRRMAEAASGLLLPGSYLSARQTGEQTVIADARAAGRVTGEAADEARRLGSAVAKAETEASRLNGTMSKVGAASKNVISGAAAGTETLIRGLGTANLVALGLTVTLAAVTFAVSKYAQENANAKKKLDDLTAAEVKNFDANAKKSSNKSAFKTLSSDLVAARKDLNASRDMLAERVRVSKEQAERLAEVQRERDKGAGSRWANDTAAALAGPYTDDFDRPVGTEQKALADEVNKAQDQLKTKERAFKETIFPGFVEKLTSIADDLDASFRKSRENIEDSLVAISAAVKVSKDGIANFDVSSMTQQQAAAMEGSVMELTEAVTGWQNKMTSFSGALARKEVKDLPSLNKHFDEMKSRVEWFWNDIGALMDKGAPKMMLDELISAGPEQGGDVAATWRQLFDAAGEEGAKAVVAKMKQATDAIKETNRLAVAAIAEQWLSSGEMAKDLTPQMAAEVAKEAAGVKRQIQQAMSELGASDMALDVTASLSSDQTEIEQINKYREAIATLIADIESGSSTVDSRMQNFRNALELGNPLMNSTDDNVKAAATQMQRIAGSVIANFPILEEVMASLGGQMGENLSITFGNAAIPGVNSTLAVLTANIRGALSNFQANVAEVVRGANLGGLFGGIRSAASQLNEELKSANSSSKTNDYKPQTGMPRPTTNRLPSTESLSGGGGGGGGDIAQQVRDANPPVSLLAEALDNLIGNLRAFQRASDASSEYAENFAKSLVRMAYSSDDAGRKKRDLTKITDGLIDQVKAETEAAVKSGRVQNDTAAVSKFFKDRLNELKGAIPGLVKEFQSGSRSIDDLREAVSMAQKTLEDGLFVRIDLDEGMFAVEEALDSLMKRMRDHRILMTSTHLTDRDVKAIYRESTRELIGYVRALQNAAKAEAIAGRIGADAASQQQFIREGLEKAKSLYPELAGKIDEYLSTLKAVNQETDNGMVEMTVNAEIDKAMNDIQLFQNALNGIEREIEVVLKAKIDKAMENSGGGGGGNQPIPDVTSPEWIEPPLPNGSGYRSTPVSTFTRVLQDANDAVRDSIGANKDWTTVQKEVIRQLKLAQVEYPEIKGYVDEYADAVSDIPKGTMTEITLESQGAREAVDAWNRFLKGEIPGSVRSSIDVTIPAYQEVGEFGSMVRDIEGTKVTYLTVGGEEAAKEAIRRATREALVLRDALNNPLDIEKTYLAATVALEGTASLPMANLDVGGPLSPGKTIVNNETGRQEWVLNPRQMELLKEATGQTSIPAAISALASMMGDTSGEVNLPPVLAPVGEPVLQGMPGGTEPQAAGASMNSFLDRLESILAGSGGTTVENLTVQSDQDPKSWINEALWRVSRGGI